MATNQRYFPTAEALQIPWCNNYVAKIQEVGLVVGETVESVAAIVADLKYYVWLINKWYPQVSSDALQNTAYKNRMAKGAGDAAEPWPAGSLFDTDPGDPDPAPTPVKPGILTRLFAMVARVKANAGYTDTIGTDLGIIGIADTTEHLYPEFKLTVEDGPSCQCVKNDFKKFGHSAVRIESRRNGGAWEFLDIVSTSPRRDARALLVAGQAEMREYRMRFWDHDAPGGDWSPVQKVTVGP